MIDEEQLADLRAALCDRYTAEELTEILNLSVEDIFDMFVEKCMELNLEDVL